MHLLRYIAGRLVVYVLVILFALHPLSRKVINARDSEY